MLLLICNKWNRVPFTKESSLSPETFLHPHTVVEDIHLPDEVQSYQDAVKFVVQSVTKLIGEQLIREGGLEGGRPDQADIRQGQYVWTFRSEDDPGKGILFGKIVDKKGSDYVVDICNAFEEILLPYKRVRTLPDVSLSQVR